jgi:hypothetical protein
MGFMSKLAVLMLDFKGPSPVDEAVNRATWEKISIEDGYGGAFVSHHGTKEWL